MQITQYRPNAIVTLYTETGDLVARATNDPNRAMDDDVVSITTSRDMGADCPTFSINLTRAKDWHKWITSNDLVKIVMQRPPEKRSTVFYGLVDDVRIRTAISGDSIERVISVSGRGFGKSTIDFDIGIVPEVGYASPDVGWLISNGVDLAASPSDKIIKDIWELLGSKYINYKWKNNQTLYELVKLSVTGKGFLKMMDDFNLINWNGSIWSLLKEVAEEPFYELFWEVEDEKPALKFRPTPFNKEEWENLPRVSIMEQEVVLDDIGRSDVETYTVFSVGSKAMAMDEDPYNTLGLLPYWHKPNVDKYGIRRLHVDSIYTGVVMNYEESGGDTSGKGSTSFPTGILTSVKDICNKNLKVKTPVTASQLNEIINSKTRASSAMRGKGEAFIKAGETSGLDPIYLIAHAAHETGWGNSSIVKRKHNWYGIGAFDNSPFQSAHNYKGSEAGIIDGAMWIAKNYYNRGQDTLNRMHRSPSGTHNYATDPGWANKIANIMKGISPSGVNGGGSSTPSIDMELSGNTPRLSSPIRTVSDDNTESLNRMISMQKDLYDWNVKNNRMYNGNLVVRGSNRFKVGQRLLYINTSDKTTREYYIRAVGHTFTNFEQWTTQLSVIRGMSPSERFTKPIGVYEDFQGIGIEPLSMLKYKGGIGTSGGVSPINSGLSSILPATGTQLALFPMKIIRITQGENGSYSHKGKLAIDFVGTTAKYPYYAPCDCVCMAVNSKYAQITWRSQRPVMCADGKVRSIVWAVVHECNPKVRAGTVLKKGQLMGHTGVCGNVTGDHLHMQVWEGTSWSNRIRPLSIYHVFAVNETQVSIGYGYPWKTSNFKDTN